MKALVFIVVLAIVGCDLTPSADDKQAMAQASVLEQAHAQIGMPSLQNFQEKRMAKDIYELRDKSIATHAYIVNDISGCLVYLGPSIGYGLPYATQYSAPERDIYATTASTVHHNIPQAEPNGLFMPASADGTWVLLKDPGGDATKPVYIEPRVIVSPFRLLDQECAKSAPPRVANSNGK